MASVSKREWTYNGETKTAWIVRYFAGGKHRQKTFERKKDGDKFRIRMQSEIESGIHVVDADALTVHAVSDEFLRADEDKLRDGRIGAAFHMRVGIAVRLAIVPYLGKMRMRDITVSDLERWYSDLCRLRGEAPYCVRIRVQLISRIFIFAIKRGYAKKNPAREALSELRGIERPVIRTFTRDEMKALITTLQNRRVGHKRRSAR